jgi:hypothetical protein
MPADEPIMQTPTHSVTEVEVTALGVPVSRFASVAIATLAGLVPAAIIARDVGLPMAAPVAFGPGAAVVVIQYLLRDKPPGWVFQFVETKLTGAHMSPLHPRRPCRDL